MEDSGVALHDFYGFACGWAYEDGIVGRVAGYLGWTGDYLYRLFGE